MGLRMLGLGQRSQAGLGEVLATLLPKQEMKQVLDLQGLIEYGRQRQATS